MIQQTMTKSYPRVSVIMSNYNGMKLDLLIESLSSILKNDYPNLEVILVDNASTDKSVSSVEKKFSRDKRLILIQNQVNMYSQGLNLGLSAATGKYAAFFNNDVVVDNGYFQKFVGWLDKNPKVGLAQGKLVSYFDHSIIDSAGETIDDFGTPITIGAGESVKDHFTEQAQVLSVSGSCSMLRMSILVKTGLFDPRYGIGYEDLDLALRTWASGYEVIYYPKVEAFHKRGATDLSPMVRVQARWHFNKNRLATMIKNFPVDFLIKSLAGILVIYTLAGLWEIILKRRVKLGLTRFSAMGWTVLNLPQLIWQRRNTNPTKVMKVADRLIDHKSLWRSFRSFVGAR